MNTGLCSPSILKVYFACQCILPLHSYQSFVWTAHVTPIPCMIMQFHLVWPLITLLCISFHSTACFNLEEYQTAKAALETGAALAPGDQIFTNLIQQCDKRIAGV